MVLKTLSQCESLCPLRKEWDLEDIFDWSLDQYGLERDKDTEYKRALRDIQQRSVSCSLCGIVLNRLLAFPASDLWPEDTQVSFIRERRGYGDTTKYKIGSLQGWYANTGIEGRTSSERILGYTPHPNVDCGYPD